MMALVRSSMERIVSRTILPRNSLSVGVLEQLFDNLEKSFISGGKQGGLPKFVDLVDHGHPNLCHLSIELGSAESSDHLRVNISQNLLHGRQIAALRRQVELGVVVPPGHLLHVLLPPSLVDPLPGIRQNQRRCRRRRRRRWRRRRRRIRLARFRRRNQSRFQVSLTPSYEKFQFTSNYRADPFGSREKKRKDEFKFADIRTK